MNPSTHPTGHMEFGNQGFRIVCRLNGPRKHFGSRPGGGVTKTRVQTPRQVLKRRECSRVSYDYDGQVPVVGLIVTTFGVCVPSDHTEVRRSPPTPQLPTPTLHPSRRRRATRRRLPPRNKSLDRPLHVLAPGVGLRAH